VIHLLSPERVKRARSLVLAGLDFSAQARHAYLAETDDDREWMPSPRQHSHPVPLDVDADLYQTWADVLDDVRRLIHGEEGLSMRELAALFDAELAAIAPDAYIDFRAMFEQPTDLRFAQKQGDDAKQMDDFLHGLLGHGYRKAMKPSPLVGRMRAVVSAVQTGTDELGKKLRYLIWVN
jgi:hypothetical protein